MVVARQSTARTVIVGPVLDSTGVAVTDGVVGDFKIAKNGGAPAALNGSATLTHRNTGHYSLALTASDLDTVGQAEIVIDDTTNACPVKEITVIEEAVYDAFYAASALGYVANAPVNVAQFGGSNGTFSSGRPEVNTTHVSGTSQTAKDIGGAVPAAAAGASGGLLISGSNSGTTTLAALTVSGATTLTGNVSMAAGLNITQSSSNTSALVITGNGTGHGAILTSGSGATGNGLTLLAASTNGHGLKSTGTGTGDGAELTAGASGADLDANLVGTITGNITGDITGTLSTVTTLTNLPAITANWLTAAGTAADFGTEVGTAVWASGTRTLTSLSGLTVDTVTTVTNNVNAVLANTAHGGTSATLRLGSSGATPALYATNSGGNAVVFQSSVSGGIGLYCLSSGADGMGIFAEGSASGGIGVVLSGTVDGLLISQMTVTTNLIAWNPAWDAEVQSEVTDALNAYDPPTRTEATSDKDEILAAIATVDTNVDSILADTGTDGVVVAAGSKTGYTLTTADKQALIELYFTFDATATYGTADAGSLVKQIADNAGGSSLTAGEIADAVWEEALGDHSSTSGSTAEALAAAGGAGDPWITPLPGSYTSGQAGHTVGTFLNASVSSRATQTSVDTIDDLLDTEIPALTSELAKVPKSDGTVTWNATALASIQTECNDALIANNLDHLLLSAVDTNFATTVHANSVIGHLADNGAGFDRTTDSLEAIRDRGDAAWVTATGFSTHSAADVWAVTTRLLTAGTNIVLAKGSGVTGFTDLNATQVENAVWDALKSNHTTADTFGDYLDDEITSRMATFSLPANFSDLAITASTGRVTAGTVSDKTGYSISGTTTTLDALQTALNSTHGAGSWATATGFSTHTAADVWGVGTRTLTSLAGLTVDTVTTVTTTTNLTNLPAITTGWLTAAGVHAGAANKIADHNHRRTQANVEASSDGDTLSLGSLYGFIQMAQESSTEASAGFLTVYRTDGTTSLGTKQLSTDGDAEPITRIQ